MGCITKGKGGLVRTVPLNDILLNRLRLHLEDTPRGYKLFVPDSRLPYEAIKDFQRFLADHRPLAQDPDSDRPMTFHGLRHTWAAEWYQERVQRGKSPYQARKEVAKLLGHGRDDVTRIYLVSLKERGAAQMDRRPTSYDDLPLTLPVRELMPILSVGRNTAYELIHSGQIRAFGLAEESVFQKQRF